MIKAMTKTMKLPERALVTGATSGIGRATAELLARRGVEVGVLSGRPERAEETVALIRGDGGKAFPVAADLARPEQVRGLIDRLEEEHGPIDLLINNAGIGLQADVLEFSEDDLRLLFEVNFFSTVLLSRDAFRRMAGRKHGHIINVSSAAARRALPGLSVYAATKAAMHAFSQALRIEGEGVGVRVTEVLPMSVRTPFFRRAMNRSPKAYEYGFFSSTPEKVAQFIYDAVRRPKPEIYTSSLSRCVLSLDGMTPKCLDAVLAYSRKQGKGRGHTGEISFTAPSPSGLPSAPDGPARVN